MNTIRKTVLAVVLALIGSANLWATDYLFGFTDGSGVKHFIGIPASPGSSGNCEAVIILGSDKSAYQRCIWHCVDGTGSSASPVNISESTGYYLYATIPGSDTKYWLRVASSNGEAIRYTTTTGNASSVKFNSTGLLVNNSYYAYYNGTDICTSSSSSNYNNKLLTMGSFARVIASPTGYGKVFVRGDTRNPDYVNGKDAFISLDTDQEAKTGGKDGTKYYLYAKASAGYNFKGWSKSNSASSIDIAPTDRIGRNENELTYNEANGYYAIYYAMFAANFTTQVTVSVNDGSLGTAYVAYGSTFSGTSTSANDGEGQISTGIEETYSLSATPKSGYHVTWSVTNGTLSSTSDLSTTVKVTTQDGYTYAGSRYPCTVTATFEKDQYNARLSVQQSSSSVYGTSTVAVSTDGTNWSSSVSGFAYSANSDVSFTVKATPAVGYVFLGWSETNGSSTYVSTSATYNCTVKSSSSVGGTNSKTLYAVFKKCYSITINANGTPSSSGDMVVFNVTGPQTYRVSVPVGGSVVLKDVASGDYTITPQGWSWNYTVSPASDATGWNSENKSTHTFNFTTKGSTKKHDEVSKTIVKP